MLKSVEFSARVPNFVAFQSSRGFREFLGCAAVPLPSSKPLTRALRSVVLHHTAYAILQSYDLIAETVHRLAVISD